MAEISRRYEVSSEPAHGQSGWIGLYAMPGKDIQQARDRQGRVMVFANPLEAQAIAAEQMCEALNARHISSQKYGYEMMSGAEFAVALQRLGITPSEFAILYGSEQRRVMGWIDGVDRDGKPTGGLPHPARVLLGLFEDPENLERARQITAEHTYDKREAIAPMEKAKRKSRRPTPAESADIATIMPQVGELLYGSDWKAALARDLGISRDTQHRWLVGTTPIRRNHKVFAKMAALLSAKGLRANAEAKAILERGRQMRTLSDAISRMGV